MPENLVEEIALVDVKVVVSSWGEAAEVMVEGELEQGGGVGIKGLVVRENLTEMVVIVNAKVIVKTKYTFYKT